MRRYRTHIARRAEGYGKPTLDRAAQGFPTGYSAIRGREQQMIDFHGGIGNPNLGNLRRGVAKWNLEGRFYHGMSNTYFGPLADYTGY